MVEADYMGHALPDDPAYWDWFGTVICTLDSEANRWLPWASEGVVVTDHVTGALVEPLHGTGHMDAATVAAAQADYLALDRSTASCSQHTGLRVRSTPARGSAGTKCTGWNIEQYPNPHQAGRQGRQQPLEHPQVPVGFLDTEAPVSQSLGQFILHCSSLSPMEAGSHPCPSAVHRRGAFTAQGG